MIFQSVKCNNIDMIRDIITEGLEDSKFLGPNMSSLFNHCSITIQISEITLLEAYYMKLFVSQFIETGTFINTDGLNKICPNSEETINAAINIFNVMNNDDDIKIKPNTYFLPLIAIQKSAIVVLSGSNLCNIFSAIPDTFFNEVNGRIETGRNLKINEPDKYEEWANQNGVKDLSDDKIFDKILENCIIEKFIYNFYKNLSPKIMQIDLLTDASINNIYYKRLFNDSLIKVHIDEVVNPYGSLDLLNNSNKEIMKDNLIQMHNVLDFNDSNTIFDTTYLTFSIACSFYTFLELFLHLPSNYFIDHQDFKTLMMEDTCLCINSIGLYDKYKLRINTKLTDLVKLRNLVIINNKNENNISRYNYILANSYYKFSIKLSLSDIANTISTFNSMIDNTQIYGNNTLLYNEIKYIINKINKYSKSVFNLIKKG